MSKRAMLWSVGATAIGIAAGSVLVRAERPGQQPAKALRDAGMRDDVPVMVIPRGPHYLTTPAGSSRVPISVPAGFFFEGSGAVEVFADMVGVPVGAKPKRADGFNWSSGRIADIPDASALRAKQDQPYDTVMVQYQDAVLPRIGSQASVDLKLDVVKMRSPDLITVKGADETREYQASLELRPYHQEHGRSETMGSMNFTRTGVATGQFTATFYAWARYTFTPMDAGAPAVFYDLDERLTITVHDDAPTRFVVPALHDPANTTDSEDVTAALSTGTGPVDGVCQDACCCCKTDIGPGGWHCPPL